MRVDIELLNAITRTVFAFGPMPKSKKAKKKNVSNKGPAKPKSKDSGNGRTR